ncbi:MAG TPA: FtsX-like permease family protein, partial [Longimicrobiales bacterium]|nr:FtsX-like permease family protein [Longimicrobiales bacterium]
DYSRIARLSNIAAWLILVGACMNVATLMFARTATRETEIIVRNALGASRARVMVQLLVEAFVLCAVAAVVGLTGASIALQYVVRVLAEQDIQLPFWWQFGITPSTVVYAAVMALSGAALIGLLPAIRATGPRLQTALAKIATGSTSMRFGGVWSIMIVLQVTFASLCLPIAIDAAASAFRPDPPPRLPRHEYLTFRPELDGDATTAATGELPGVSFRAQLMNVYEELKRRLEAEPTVAAVTFANSMPGTHPPLSRLEAQRGSEPPVPVRANLDGDRVWTASVDIGFFDAFRLPLAAGRAFHPGDVHADRVVIINEALARNLGGNPLGVRVRYAAQGANQEPGPWLEVVGVVRDAGADRGEMDFVYRPTALVSADPLVVAIHVKGNAAALAPRVRALAAQVEPGLRLYELLSLDEVVRRRDPIAIPAMTAVGAITLLLMALSAAALYSLMSVAVTRRTREIGIRLTIGASPRALLGALFARAAVQVGIGIVLANALLMPLMSALGQIERVSDVLPKMLAASCAMLLMGLAACAVPARRALRIQPTEAVRYNG